MAQKELLNGNRDPLLEFSDTMAQWYRLQTKRAEEREVRARPSDRSPYWIIHVIEGSGPVPPAGRLRRAGTSLSELRKYDRKSFLIVTDDSGLPLGFEVLDEGWSCLCNVDFARGEGSGVTSTFHKIVTLLQKCMDAPMGGGTPRQPERLRVNDKVLHRVLRHYTVKQGSEILGAELLPKGPAWEPLDQEGAPAFSLRWPPVHYCNLCKRRSFVCRLQECSHCKAVFYCADKCFPADAEHEGWCAKLAGYMEHAAQLADLPFSYAAEVTSEDFSLEDFLSKHKLVTSYWVHWSLLVHPSKAHSATKAYSSWLKGHSNAYEPLKQEADMFMFGPDPHNPPCLKKPLVSWHQYYDWRGLSLSSVVAPLLSSSLSIYYIITSLVPKHFPEVNILNKQSLRIHIIESYRELYTLLILWELSVLLPHVAFELVFVCERLPCWYEKVQLLIQKVNGSVNVTDSGPEPQQRADKRSIRVKVFRCSYHVLQEPEPDLVIGFKPAFQRYDSWFSTLPKLQALRVPAFFCEISELKCESSQQVMNEATGGYVSTPAINPFHCPLRINGGDNRLPRYSNGFIFHLVYKPVVRAQHPVAVSSCSVQPDQHAQSPLESPHLSFRERKAAQRHRHKQAKMKRKKMLYCN